ncbi:MAG: MFS transporter [Rhodospirillales bacterium 70-18]|nr:MAG: MFS transporter [Rhodospirillales bacterium 70-18]
MQEPDGATTPVDAPPAFTHRQITRVVTGIMLCILLAAVDQTVVVPAVPAIAADLNGFGHLAWIVSAYLLTSTSAAPIYGKMSDIYGRRPLLLFAIALFMAASALCALAQTLPQLIAARAIQGLGGAGLMAMAQATIADVVAPRERGRYQGYMAGAWAVASVAGPIVGGWMTDSLSWRWIFWMNLPLGVAAFLLSGRALKLLRHQRRAARIDYLGAALMTGCVTASLLVMSWGGVEYAWGSPEVLGMGGLAVALLAALVVQQRLAPDPLLPPRLFANNAISSGVAIAFLTTGGMLGGTFLLPLFFQLTRGADASSSGTLIVPFLAASAAGAFNAGQLARRFGKVKGIVVGGLVVATAGFMMLAAAGAETPLVVVLLAMAVVGAGLGTCGPTAMVIVQNAAERRDVGAATGALLLLRSMGGAFGSTLVGALLASSFAQGLAAAGVAQRIDLGALRAQGGGAVALEPAVAAAAHTALASSFHLAFGVCAAMSLAALAVCAVMRDLPLRSGEVKPGGAKAPV